MDKLARVHSRTATVDTTETETAMPRASDWGESRAAIPTNPHLHQKIGAMAHDGLRRPVRDALVIGAAHEASALLRREVRSWQQVPAIDVAPSAEQGFSLLTSGRYRLLLLDLRADGLSILHRLRTQPLARPPAVLALCDAFQTMQAWGAIEAGADDYLIVPCEVADLELRMHMWLRRVGATTSNGQPGLRIQSLGGFSVLRDGALCVQESGRARKVNALLKFLLTHQERTISNGEVLDLIWPDAAQKVAATDLRSLLHQLRRLLGTAPAGASYLEHTVTTVGLRLSSVDWWDVREFLAWITEATHWHKVGDTERALRAYQAAIDLYDGDYLPDDRYADWAVAMREHLREQWLRALNALAALYAQRGEHEAQEAALRRILRADPYREQTLRLLMELLAGHGRSAEALVLYRKVRDLLMAELDAHPDPETRALATYIGQRAR